MSAGRSFAFQQGDTLGWSGNSGGSSGPHLHFEVRETATQRPVNPLFWGFDVPDSVAPELSGLWVLPTGGSRVNGNSRPQLISPAVGTVRIAGEARFGIEALDRLDGARNSCGITALGCGSTTSQYAELDTLDFAVNRDMNDLRITKRGSGQATNIPHAPPPGSRRLSTTQRGPPSTRHDTVPLRIELWTCGNTRSMEWTTAWTAAQEGRRCKVTPMIGPQRRAGWHACAFRAIRF